MGTYFFAGSTTFAFLLIFDLRRTRGGNLNGSCWADRKAALAVCTMSGVDQILFEMHGFITRQRSIRFWLSAHVKLPGDQPAFRWR
ncbi:hypothetical protein SPFL3102_02334 [Sporomusaceae bacterium FL31]|nr:hypothetical protein SPFL3101_02250 [Sporomusaceae bacterium FL31]GCE34521.1 hypothetical protein SPFL3102_02334 [Sporomusaceae bacterium]